MQSEIPVPIEIIQALNKISDLFKDNLDNIHFIQILEIALADQLIRFMLCSTGFNKTNFKIKLDKMKICLDQIAEDIMNSEEFIFQKKQIDSLFTDGGNPVTA